MIAFMCFSGAGCCNYVHWQLLLQFYLPEVRKIKAKLAKSDRPHTASYVHYNASIQIQMNHQANVYIYQYVWREEHSFPGLEMKNALWYMGMLLFLE